MPSSRYPKAPPRRGQVIPRGIDKWLLRVYLGRQDGKRQYHSEMVTGKHSQAQQRLTRLLADLDQGTFVQKSDLTLGEYVDEWLGTKVDLKEKTRLDYEHRIKKDLTGHPIARVRLDQLTTLPLQKWIGSLSSDRQLSPRTIQYTVSIVSQALSYAVETGMLVKNACDKVTLPRRIRQEMPWLTPDQVVQFLDANVEDPWIALWRLLLTSGLRPQEALALKWVDLQDRRLMIRRALAEVEKGAFVVVDELKTDSSRRTVSLSEETVAALEAHRKRQLKVILEMGPKYQRDDFMFTTRLGTTLDRTPVRRWWFKALDRAKLPRIRLYSTRHTHLTHLLMSGVNVKAVAARSGHANPNVLLSVYAHALPEVDQGAAQGVEDMLKDYAQRRREKQA